MTRIGMVWLVAALGLLAPRPGLAAEGKAKLKPVLSLKSYKKIELIEGNKVFTAIHPGGRVELFAKKGKTVQGRLYADGRFVGPRGTMAVHLLPDGKMTLVKGEKVLRLPLKIDAAGELTYLLQSKSPPLVIKADGTLSGGNPESAKQTARFRVRGASTDAARRVAMFVLTALLMPAGASPPPPANPPAKTAPRQGRSPR